MEVSAFSKCFFSLLFFSSLVAECLLKVHLNHVTNSAVRVKLILQFTLADKIDLVRSKYHQPFKTFFLRFLYLNVISFVQRFRPDGILFMFFTRHYNLCFKGRVSDSVSLCSCVSLCVCLSVCLGFQ